MTLQPYVPKIFLNIRFCASSIACLAIFISGAAALCPSRLAAQTVQEVPKGTPSTTTESPEATGALKVGDMIKMVVYEALSSDEDKWSAPPGQQDAAPRGFYQRPELTGEYLVDADGAISLPLLGRFAVRGFLPRAVEASIVHSYEALVAKKGFVTILSIVHQPVYITGTVKNPGIVKYSEGMTVLHAVAFAGGMSARSLEPWQKVEVTRQIERLKSGLTDLKRLTSRTEVLRTARDNVRTASIDGMPGTGLDQDTRQLVNDEQWQRQLVTVSQGAQKDALTKSVENARADLELRQKRVGTYDNTIFTRRDRLKSIENLARNKLVSTIELTRAQSELSDAEDRKQQAIIDVENATQRLSTAQQDLVRHGTESKIEIEKSVSDAERGMATAVRTTESDLDIFQSMVSSMESGSNGTVKFEIMRHGKDGISVEPATEETILQPGDLVHVR